MYQCPIFYQGLRACWMVMMVDDDDDGLFAHRSSLTTQQHGVAHAK